jgi:hypothetical protein
MQTTVFEHQLTDVTVVFKTRMLYDIYGSGTVEELIFLC